MSTPPNIVVPENYTLHQENSAYLLLPSEKGAFLNTIQEFNRDLSVACIKTWGERSNREKLARFQSNQSKGKAPAKKKRRLMFRPFRFTVLEPLSATGLRAIRYCKEIPLVKQVIANDLSKDATIAMKRNVEINGLTPPDEIPDAEDASSKAEKRNSTVRVNHGDASALMYTIKAQKKPIHVIDLDPYGTASPFIDAAVQTISDDGLLCITCTDLAVLAGTNYPEKCFANYGGTPMKGEYCHEGALRLLLGAVASSAARYGRSITPLLSLSIDFYIRVFVQVRSSPVEVKKLSSKMAVYYTCTFCQNWYEQPLGRIMEKVSEGSGHVNLLYRTAPGPTTESHCEQCGTVLHVAGPMWSSSIHDKPFVQEVLELVNTSPEAFGTHVRMQGMLTVASEELDVPFYFTPSKIANAFHSEAPPLIETASALLNAGHQVSRSHALAGSLKTTATRAELNDLLRSWIKLHPVKMANIKPGSPSLKLLEKEPSVVSDFKKHPDALRSPHTKLVRYQTNPTANWGPASRAGKRKPGQDKTEDQGDEEEMGN
ncbi:N2,N2-dimethylguanosine tRNA methyltransferase [Clavulina sp. PMI_390]|nr:N2,N2-dimethylguanosine tRNA methyltransferase [Clavulina sp. PMI_390]